MKFMKPNETARVVMFVIPVADLEGTIAEQREALAALLTSYGSFKAWALVLHDRDEEPPHWQGIAVTDKNYTGRIFSGRLGVPGVYKLAGGQRAITGGLAYLTHEGHPAKAQYPRSSITATPGWDWESQLDAAILADAGRGNAGRKKVIASVQDGHLTALEAIRRGASNERAVRVARARYLSSIGSEDLPGVRVNFYLQGVAHPSLDRLAQALARSLSKDQRFYAFNGREVDEYDGEDVVLMRSRLEAWVREIAPGMVDISSDGPLGGPRELLGMLSATPTAHTFVTKFGRSQLVHRHTVIVGDEPFEAFRRRLETVYESVVDDGTDQAALSLPVIVPVDADSFRVQVSERFVLGRGELNQFIESERYRLDLGAALAQVRRLPQEDRPPLVYELEQRQTAPIRQAGTAVAQALQPSRRMTGEDILASYADLGSPVITGELA